MNRILTTLATLALVSTFFAGTATAHAKFQSSTPAPGQILATAPANVTITFTEDLAVGSTGSVVNAAGATVSTTAIISTSDRKVLTIALKPGLPNSTYTVRWHSISADDGDPLDGTFSFTVGSAAVAPKTLPSTSTLPERDNSGLGLALLGAALLVGTLTIRARRPTKA